MTSQALEPTGTFQCPICFRDEPHEHSDADVHKYRQAQISKIAKQQEARDWPDSRILKGLQDAARGAVAQLEGYEKRCSFCRMFNDSLIRRFCGTVYAYGDFGLVERGNARYCPKCDQCVWRGES